MIMKYINNFGSINGKPQSGKETFYPKRTLKDSELNIFKSIEEQFNLLRVVDNERYPAHFFYKGKKYLLKIYKDNE